MIRGTRSRSRKCKAIRLSRMVSLYATTPSMHVIALEAATGKELWNFDPNQGKPPGRRFRHRGVTVSKDRVFATYRNFLFALNKTTGQPIPSFGDEGRIDLRQGLDR